jgi:N utilization substance protein B
MALWELNQKGAIPSIIINEAIELAKQFAEQDSYRFINGILDEICKDRGLTVPDKSSDSDGALNSDEENKEK